MFRPHLPFLFPLLLALPSVASSAPGPQRSGDSLPPGAVGRLGVAPSRARTADADDTEEYLRGIHRVCISEDGKTVTTRKGHGTVQMWELATGKLLHQWQLKPELTHELSP